MRISAPGFREWNRRQRLDGEKVFVDRREKREVAAGASGERFERFTRKVGIENGEHVRECGMRRSVGGVKKNEAGCSAALIRRLAGVLPDPDSVDRNGCRHRTQIRGIVFFEYDAVVPPDTDIRKWRRIEIYLARRRLDLVGRVVPDCEATVSVVPRAFEDGPRGEPPALVGAASAEEHGDPFFAFRAVRKCPKRGLPGILRYRNRCPTIRRSVCHGLFSSAVLRRQESVS